MSLMREIGIDWYIPRASLANQLPQLNHVILTPSKDLSVESSHAATADSSVASTSRTRPKLDIELDAIPAKKLAVKPPVKSPVAVAEAIRDFDLLVASNTNYIFVCDIKASPLNAVWERSVRQFLDEISFSLGALVNEQCSLDYFSCPLQENVRSNLGEIQLSQLLNGFLQQRVSVDKKVAVLFGDNAQRYVDPFLLAKNIPMVKSTNLGKLFSMPVLKAQLWSDLQLIS
jgi:hypothetical protein